MWPGPKPTYMPSFILIRPTVWPQYANVTDRTNRTGQTTVRWHRANRFTNGRPKSQTAPKNRTLRSSLRAVNRPFLLANVDSRSRSYMLSPVRLSVVCLSVCLSVTLVHPTQAISANSTAFGARRVKVVEDIPKLSATEI